MKKNSASLPPTTDRGGPRDEALAAAPGWCRKQLIHLYKVWNGYNTRYFASRLSVPYIDVTRMLDDDRVGQFGATTEGVLPSMICIDSRVLRGTRDGFRSGPRYAAGRMRFAEDVLLHEMIHQSQFEAAGCATETTESHGWDFCRTAIEIGKSLGLGLVCPTTLVFRDSDVPNCEDWPFAVRHLSYYSGAVGVSTRGKAREVPDIAATRVAIRAALDLPELMSRALAHRPRRKPWTRFIEDDLGIDLSRLEALLDVLTVQEEEAVSPVHALASVAV